MLKSGAVAHAYGRRWGGPDHLTAGYTDDASQVPPLIEAALFFLVGHFPSTARK
jgi:hypothetical protein